MSPVECHTARRARPPRPPRQLQHVEPEDRARVGLAVAQPQQPICDLRELLRRRDLDAADPAAVAVGGGPPIVPLEPWRVVVEGTRRVAVVDTEADPGRADPVDQVVDAVEDGRRAAPQVGEEADDAGYAHAAAGRSAGVDLLVGDVPQVVVDRARVGVAEEDGPEASSDDFEAAAVAGMGEVNWHAGADYRFNDPASERGHRHVLVVAGGAD